jgi:hypothetical protein
MIDTLSILLVTVAVLYLIWRAVMLDASAPWFPRPKDPADPGGPGGAPTPGASRRRAKR